MKKSIKYRYVTNEDVVFLKRGKMKCFTNLWKLTERNFLRMVEDIRAKKLGKLSDYGVLVSEDTYPLQSLLWAARLERSENAKKKSRAH